MKKIFPVITVLACILLTGCSKKEDKTDSTATKQDTTSKQNIPVPTTIEKKEDANASTEEKNKTKEPEKKNDLRDKSGAIRIQFPAGATYVTLNGQMKGAGDKITYVFEAGAGQKLYAAVMPIDSKGKEYFEGNIRINQIFTPSGKIDGPFGLKAKYPLQESGNYKLVLGENQMAGEPWKGEYKLTVQIIK